MLNLDKNILIRNSTSALRHNIKQIKKLLPKDCLLSVAVKANAYGHGLVETSRELSKLGVDWLCVTSAEEGAKLRSASIKVPILIIGPISESDLKIILENNLKTFIYDLNLAKKLNRLAKNKPNKPSLHLKLNTGMNRQGINPKQLKKFLREISKLKNINLEGIATHFATADESKNNETFLEQLKVFKTASELAEKLIGKKLIKHCANSAATLLYPQTHFDLVRIGIAAYGCYPSPVVKKIWESKHQPLQPVMSITTKITHLENIPINSGVSYGLTFKTKKPTRLALLPIGYFDGFSRLLSNRGKVIINGKLAPITGRICMDISLVDVSKIKNIKVGDEAIIIGSDKKQQISADDLAVSTSTINYEILTNWKENIKRIYQ